MRESITSRGITMDKTNASDQKSYGSLVLVILFAFLLSFLLYGSILYSKLKVNPIVKDLVGRIELALADNNKGQTVRVREVEFDPEIQRLKAQLAASYVQLPVSTELEAFIDSFKEKIGQAGIEVKEYKSKIIDQRKGYLRCRIVASLSAP